MSFRYQFKATISKIIDIQKGSGFDANGNPIDVSSDPILSNPIEFECDYLPTITTPLFSSNGSFAKVSYILYVPNTVKINFFKGDNITCNGVTGEIVEVFPTRFNKTIWVK